MAINNEPTVQPRTVTGIFTKYIAKTLPLAFDESMSYYECLCALLEYINQTIVPDINNVNDGLGELQEFYEELQSYVNNYLTDENLQPLINNRLDEYVEDGTMDQLINQEIFGALNTRVETLETNDLTHLVVIGDSYTASYDSDWAERVASQLHLTLVKLATGGMGFVHAVSDKVFVDRLSEISNDVKNKVKYLICYGGINDNNEADFSTVTTAVTTFCETAKTTCPNAQILIVGPQIGVTDANKLKNLKCIGAIEKGARDGGCSYTNANDWLINEQHPYTETYRSDNLHPSALGCKIIASKMLGVINNTPDGYLSIIPTAGSSYTGKICIKGNNEYLDILLTFTAGTLATGDNELATFTTSNDLNFLNTDARFVVIDRSNGSIIGTAFITKSPNKIYINNNTGSSITLSSTHRAICLLHYVNNMTEISFTAS